MLLAICNNDKLSPSNSIELTVINRACDLHSDKLDSRLSGVFFKNFIVIVELVLN